MEQELYKTRSAAACVKAAYHLLYEQRQTLFRKLWLPALCLAAAVATAYVPFLQLVSPLLIIAAALWYYARIFTVLNGLSEGKNGLKIAKIYVAYVVLTLLVIALIGAIIIGLLMLLPRPVPDNHCGMYIVGYFAVAFVVAAIVTQLLVALPLSYFFMKYMVEDVSIRRNLWPSYKTGLRHWGLLFLTSLIVGLVLVIICLVLFMPQFILFGAQAMSSAGVLMGDEAGLPASFSWLTVLSTMLTYFVLALLYIWPIFSLYYAYGSIAQQEKERRATAVSATPHE